MEGNTHDHQKGSFDFEFFIDPPTLDRVAPQLLVETVAFGGFEDTRGEDLKRETMGFDRRDPLDVG